MVKVIDDGRGAMEELMREAEAYATMAMRKMGRLPATLLLHGVNGGAMFAPRPMSSEQSKDHFATTARLMCIAEGADATVFVSEAWMRTQKKGEKLDLSKAPSECADRQEVVIIMGETREGCMQKTLPIERSENGRFLGFKESPVTTEHVKGRFAQFLPPTFPNQQEMRQATQLLEMLGIHQSETRKRGQEYGRGM